MRSSGGNGLERSKCYSGAGRGRGLGVPWRDKTGSGSTWAEECRLHYIWTSEDQRKNSDVRCQSGNLGRGIRNSVGLVDLWMAYDRVCEASSTDQRTFQLMMLMVMADFLVSTPQLQPSSSHTPRCIAQALSSSTPKRTVLADSTRSASRAPGSAEV